MKPDPWKPPDDSLQRAMEAIQGFLREHEGDELPLDDVGLTREWLPPGEAPPRSQRTPTEISEAAADPHRRCDQYVLMSRVGQGAMGDVWKAWDIELHRWAALKMLKFKGAAAVNRFVREARIVAGIAHPNLVSVYGTGTFNGTPYIALQFGAGSSIETFKGPVLRAVELTRDAARGLGAAHRAGIIHRDVKPENILLDASGRVLVTDFGLAHLDSGMDGSDQATGPHAILGTPAFMSPEQAAGETHRITAASDIYSLGATLYFLCTRRYACSGQSSPEMLANTLAGTITPPGNHVAGFPADLEAVILKALALRPQDRYATAEELAQDLDRILRDEPVAARRGNPVGVARRWRRKNPRLAFGLVVAAVVAAAGIGWVAKVQRSASVMDEKRTLRRKAAEILQPATMALNLWETAFTQYTPAERTRIERAIAESLALVPDFGAAWVERGRFQWFADDLVGAEASLGKAIEDRESRGVGHFYRARVRSVMAGGVSFRPMLFITATGIDLDVGSTIRELPKETTAREGAIQDLVEFSRGVEGGVSDERVIYGRALMNRLKARTPGEFLAVAEEYRVALESMKVSRWEAYFHQGQAYLLGKAFARAVAAFEECARAGKSDPDLLTQLGLSHILLSLDPSADVAERDALFDRGVDVLRGIVNVRERTHYPLSYLGLARLARCILRHGAGQDVGDDPDLGIEDLSQLLDVEPDRPFDLENRGSLLQERAMQRIARKEDPLPDFERSIVDLERATQLGVPAATTWSVLGLSYALRARYLISTGRGAVEDLVAADGSFKKALAGGWDRVLSWRVYVLEHLLIARATDEERLRDARLYVEELTSYIEGHPSNPVGWEGRGILRRYEADALKGVGLSDELSRSDAIADFTKAIEIDGTRARCYRLRGCTNGDLLRWNEAIRDFRKCIELRPSEAEEVGPFLSHCEEKAKEK